MIMEKQRSAGKTLTLDNTKNITHCKITLKSGVES